MIFINSEKNRLRNQFSFDFEILVMLVLSAGELALRWNQIVPNLLVTFEKLKKLGYTYYNGKISIIELKKEEKRV